MKVPKLGLNDDDDQKEKEDHLTSALKHKRQLSDSSRGSIGRKERLRNALTGRSDGSADGADQPKELPKQELVDFLLQYDRTDPIIYKLIEEVEPYGQVERVDESNLSGQGSINSDTKLSDNNDDKDEKTERDDNNDDGSDNELNRSEFEGGSGDPNQQIFHNNLSSETDSEFRNKQEVGYPSFEEAIEMKFDLNKVTNIQQRLRNLNCQPRDIQELYPAPFHLLTKREKRCKECHKFVIKPNVNPTSNEKMKADFQMMYYVPKCMIYRTGKYTPYKGHS